MRAFRFSCITYLGVALPGSTLGLLWPSVRVSLHEPVSALGIFLAVGVAASVMASAATGPLLSKLTVGALVASGAALVSLALGTEATTSSFLVFASCSALFSLGFGALDSALNAYAAAHFGPRHTNWMHASYGLGATVGPLVVTAMLTDGLTWRWAMGVMCFLEAGLTLVLVLGRASWRGPASPAHEPGPRAAAGPASRRSRRGSAGATSSALVFSAVETGIESAAGIWGYLFLTSGRGMPHSLAGVAVSAYWAMMFVGRAVLGPVAERFGTRRVLGISVVGVAASAAVMAMPGPALLAVTGMMALGLAAAPIFPLLTLTTAERSGTAEAAKTTRTVALQVAASTIGSAALPAGVGVVIGATNAKALALSLLLLGIGTCGVYGVMTYLGRRDGPEVLGRRA